jgi:hypothetical protein
MTRLEVIPRAGRNSTRRGDTPGGLAVCLGQVKARRNRRCGMQLSNFAELRTAMSNRALTHSPQGVDPESAVAEH